MEAAPMANPSSPTPYQQQARVFLKRLDANTKQFHFRTFDDKPKRGRLTLIGNFSGSIMKCEQVLRERNANDAGVFVVINEGGHKDDAITRVRAVFADTDGAPLEPIIQALEPHCVICTSPGKWHVYWLVDEDFPLDQFKPVQKAIAEKFKTDQSVNNLSRVMRLPGFLHNKKEPYEVQFHSLNSKLPHYSHGQIVEALGFTAHTLTNATTLPAHRAANSPVLQALYSNSYRLSDVEPMLQYIDPWCDREKWLKVLFALAEEYGEEARDLAVRWSRGDLWQGQQP